MVPVPVPGTCPLVYFEGCCCSCCASFYSVTVYPGTRYRAINSVYRIPGTWFDIKEEDLSRSRIFCSGEKKIIYDSRSSPECSCSDISPLDAKQWDIPIDAKPICGVHEGSRPHVSRFHVSGVWHEAMYRDPAPGISTSQDRGKVPRSGQTKDTGGGSLGRTRSPLHIV